MALKYLRDNLKSLTWILWSVVGVFVLLVFFEWGGVNDLRGGNIEVAATVGGEEISYAEFRQQYRNLEARYRETFGEQFNRELAQQFNLPVQALDQLINRRILLMEAREIGLQATDSEVRDAILEYPAFLDESGTFIGTERYQQILRANRMSFGEFEDSLREDVLLGKLNAILAQTAYVSDAEVEESYREQAERAEIRFVQLPASEFAAEGLRQPGGDRGLFQRARDRVRAAGAAGRRLSAGRHREAAAGSRGPGRGAESLLRRQPGRLHPRGAGSRAPHLDARHAGSA